MSWISDIIHWIFGPRPQPPAPPVPVPQGTIAALLVYTNQARHDRGLSPLALNDALCRSAQDCVNRCRRDGRISHLIDGTTPGGRMTTAGYRWSAEGECLAQGQTTPQQAINDWLSDPPHAAELLGNYRDVGFGVNGDMWCADFGTPL